MPVAAPSQLDEALALLRDQPDTQVLAGGTDLMVEVNAGHRRPTAVLSLHNLRSLRERRLVGDTLELGACVTYADLAADDVAAVAPALTAAARTVGSPQIRNAGTIGGNLGTASPAGDTLPVLAALDARVRLASAAGTRTLAWDELIVGVKRTARRPDELIVAVEVPLLDSRQDYLKVGTRNAMVISVAGLALVVDFGSRTVRCALGSVGPVPLRTRDAEAWVVDHIDWDARTVPDPRTAETFGTMVGEAARPIDDHRSTADYRRHAIRVLAQRALLRLL